MGKNWNDVLGEVNQTESPFDRVRRQYLRELHEYTNRNIIAYYSGWLQKPSAEHAYVCSINDDDKNGFMACCHGIRPELGLDLLLHSPGGDVAATESIIHYLRSKFQADIRVIVPQISMSGGTMIACCGYEIIMGRQSNLGPIDPQMGGRWPAIAVINEFERAFEEIKEQPEKIAVWRPILEQYSPTFLSTCENAIKWSKTIGKEALIRGMFKDIHDREDRADRVIERLIRAVSGRRESRGIPKGLIL